jgi:ubiquitin-protein ligase
MQWHANITGPLGTEYHDVTFHLGSLFFPLRARLSLLTYYLVLKFPSSYPRKPPTIRICTRLLHPNVYGNWVCLDMLEIGAFGSGPEADRINTGWSSGYSVVSIMLQLQTFLFSDNLANGIPFFSFSLPPNSHLLFFMTC